MKRKVRIIALIAGLLIVVSYVITWGSKAIYFSETEALVTLRFHYIESCGDCPPQWSVDSVLYDSRYSYLKYKGMEVFYKGKNLEEHLGPDVNWNCIICSGLTVTGIVKRTLRGNFRLVAENYKYEYTADQTCCSQSSIQ